MGAAHDQAEKRGLEVGARQHRGVDVTPQVIDAGERFRPRGRQALADPHTYQQAAHQARAASDREQVDVRRLDLRLLQGKVEQAGQPFEMVARGKLGDHAAELPVQVDLGVDHVGQHFAPAFNDRDGGFVA